MPLAAALVILFLPLAVRAAEPVVPGAGSILQQTQPVVPPTPSSTGPGLAIEPPGGGTLPPTAPFLVKAIEVAGNTLFDTPTLHALVADAEGKSFTLPQLGQIAARITDYYHSHGYLLDRAIIPAQTIQDGLVRIEIIEARYGQIALDNHSRVVDSLLQATLAPLQSMQAISDDLKTAQGASATLNSSNFGQITADISGNNGLLAGDYRVIQFAMKFVF